MSSKKEILTPRVTRFGPRSERLQSYSPSDKWGYLLTVVVCMYYDANEVLSMRRVSQGEFILD